MKNRNKKIVMMASIILIFSISVAGTFAWLFTNSETVTNTFVSAKVGNYVVETTTGTTKSDVMIQNHIDGTADDSELIDAYIRATYVVTWQKTEDGVTYVLPADDEDYDISLNPTGDWDTDTADGYFYHKTPVKPGVKTGVMIASIAPKAGAAPDGHTVDDGYKLNVEIISQSIQAVPATVVVDNWGVTLSGTSISK